MHALPKALAKRGHRVMCIAPRYKNYDDAWETGVRHRMNVFNNEQEVGEGGVAWWQRRRW
jgi:starch synthase